MLAQRCAGEETAIIGNHCAAHDANLARLLPVDAEDLRPGPEGHVVPDLQQVVLHDVQRRARPEDALAHLGAHEPIVEAHRSVVRAHNLREVANVVMKHQVVHEPIPELLPLGVLAQPLDEAAHDKPLHGDGDHDVDHRVQRVAHGGGEPPEHDAVGLRHRHAGVVHPRLLGRRPIRPGHHILQHQQPRQHLQQLGQLEQRPADEALQQPVRLGVRQAVEAPVLVVGVLELVRR
mmetsp:Transcript_46202/g.119493  ORF Transcript_46202/g.119493 Transcript_46202/m.119493 type:complete len:234 (-) Transcript_46202:3189-3890(-)